MRQIASYLPTPYAGADPLERDQASRYISEQLALQAGSDNQAVAWGPNGAPPWLIEIYGDMPDEPDPVRVTPAQQALAAEAGETAAQADLTEQRTRLRGAHDREEFLDGLTLGPLRRVFKKR